MSSNLSLSASSFRTILTALLVCGFGLGCSQRLRPPATVPVSGVVLWQGKPAAGIRVTLHPKSRSRLKFSPQGETGSDGTFQISTGAPGNGAPPGEYVVTFEKPFIQSDQNNGFHETEIDAFQGKYSNPEESAWNVTVRKGDNSLEPFELN